MGSKNPLYSAIEAGQAFRCRPAVLFNASMKRTETPTEAPIIHPQAVYSPAQAASLLGLARSTIKAERRAGRLRIGRRGNKYYIWGAWLIEWLEAGELPRRGKPVSVSSTGAKEGKTNG